MATLATQYILFADLSSLPPFLSFSTLSVLGLHPPIEHYNMNFTSGPVFWEISNLRHIPFNLILSRVARMISLKIS